MRYEIDNKEAQDKAVSGWWNDDRTKKWHDFTYDKDNPLSHHLILRQKKVLDYLKLLKLPNGSKYTGVWKEGVLDGRGIFIEPSGFIDAGQFKCGTLWKGTHFFENGDKFVGEWKMGEPWNIEYFNKKGELIGEIYREGEFPSNSDLKVYDRIGEIIDYSL